MMPVELEALLNQVQALKTEIQTLELKAAAQGCPTRLYDTLPSFSNQDGGRTILFGKVEAITGQLISENLEAFRELAK